MTFIASKILWALVQPSNLLLLLLATGVALSWTGWQKWGRRLATIATLALLAIAILPVGGWLYHPLETRFAVPKTLPETISGIIVLGGATSPALTERWDQPSLNDNSERLVALVSLARRYPSARLIFTGGSGSLRPGRLREADVVRRVLDDIGFSSQRVTYESRARNTIENAVNTFDLVRPTKDENWLLVTSAYHMPRAVGCFRTAGWTVIPYPVDYRMAGRGGIGFRLKMSQGLRAFDKAVHEWTGLIAYRLFGRTAAIFPAPLRNE
ncbi:MAG: YdcF family protein [Proteobacteria bacterium]|nr:YdcF family protein [Pseudomonadota bacterium]